MKPMEHSTQNQATETAPKPVPVKIHRKPKTERRYERVQHVMDLIQVIQKHGNRVAFSYFGPKRKVLDMTYAEFGHLIKKVAAGLTEQGYAKKRIALIGETSVEWLATYLAILATGGVAIPMDKELEIPVIEGFLDSVNADGILYSASFNGKFASTMETHKSLSLFLPIAPNEDELKNEKVLPFAELLKIGSAAVKNGYKYPPVENREGLCEMLFTSGTTGTSKCVMLSQKTSSPL